MQFPRCNFGMRNDKILIRSFPSLGTSMSFVWFVKRNLISYIHGSLWRMVTQHTLRACERKNCLDFFRAFVYLDSNFKSEQKKSSYPAYHAFTCAQIIRINHLVHILKAKASNIFAYTVLKNYIRKSGAPSKIRLGWGQTRGYKNVQNKKIEYLKKKQRFDDYRF